MHVGILHPLGQPTVTILSRATGSRPIWAMPLLVLGIAHVTLLLGIVLVIVTVDL